EAVAEPLQVERAVLVGTAAVDVAQALADERLEAGDIAGKGRGDARLVEGENVLEKLGIGHGATSMGSIPARIPHGVSATTSRAANRGVRSRPRAAWRGPTTAYYRPLCVPRNRVEPLRRRPPCRPASHRPVLRTTAQGPRPM